MTQEFEIVRIPVTPASAFELVQVLDGARTSYLAAPVCQDVKLFINEARNEVAAIVTWASAPAHAQALQTPQAASFFKAVSAFAAGRPDVRSYKSAELE